MEKLWIFCLKRNILTLAIVAIFTWGLSADAPLAAPEFQSLISRDRSTQIDSDPVKKLITAYAIDNGERGKLLWEIPEWSRWIDISSDGQFCIVDFTGGLLAMDFRLDEPVLKIFESGRLKSALSIRDLLNDLLELRRTTSHYSWNREIKYEGNETIIWTVDSKVVVSRTPFEIRKYKLTEEEIKAHGIGKESEVSKLTNWFSFIGK